HESFERAMAKIELLRPGQHLSVAQTEPVAVSDAKLDQEPVRQVDEILVFDATPRDLRTHPVVAAGEIGTRVMTAVRARPDEGATRGEVAVPERAQGLARALLARVEALVHESPGRRGF